MLQGLEGLLAVHGLNVNAASMGNLPAFLDTILVCPTSRSHFLHLNRAAGIADVDAEQLPL